MFISGGENVYPAEIERVLLQHTAIAEAAVVGIPDDKWEVGKAFVVCKHGINIAADDLIAYCRTYLAKFKVPKYIVFMDVLPKNDTGKIDRKQLKSNI
ncbi:MAG: hypothetical protein R2795_16785 [Saprospiraceae bacterium]